MKISSGWKLQESDTCLQVIALETSRISRSRPLGSSTQTSCRAAPRVRMVQSSKTGIPLARLSLASTHQQDKRLATFLQGGTLHQQASAACNIRRCHTYELARYQKWLTPNCSSLDWSQKKKKKKKKFAVGLGSARVLKGACQSASGTASSRPIRLMKARHPINTVWRDRLSALYRLEVKELPIVSRLRYQVTSGYHLSR